MTKRMILAVALAVCTAGAVGVQAQMGAAAKSGARDPGRSGEELRCGAERI